MSELPDVETFRRTIEKSSLHRTVRNVVVSRAEILDDGTGTTDLAASLTGHQLLETRRHGKHLFARSGGGSWMALHFALDRRRRRALYRTMRTVLQAAIDAGAEPAAMPDDFLTGRREPGADCPRCDGSVERIEVSGRSAYHCPSCQPPPSRSAGRGA